MTEYSERKTVTIEELERKIRSCIPVESKKIKPEGAKSISSESICVNGFNSFIDDGSNFGINFEINSKSLMSLEMSMNSAVSFDMSMMSCVKDNDEEYTKLMKKEEELKSREILLDSREFLLNHSEFALKQREDSMLLKEETFLHKEQFLRERLDMIGKKENELFIKEKDLHEIEEHLKQEIRKIKKDNMDRKRQDFFNKIKSISEFETVSNPEEVDGSGSISSFEEKEDFHQEPETEVNPSKELLMIICEIQSIKNHLMNSFTKMKEQEVQRLQGEKIRRINSRLWNRNEVDEVQREILKLDYNFTSYFCYENNDLTIPNLDLKQNEKDSTVYYNIKELNEEENGTSIRKKSSNTASTLETCAVSEENVKNSIEPKETELHMLKADKIKKKNFSFWRSKK